MQQTPASITECYTTGSTREAYVTHRIEEQINYYEKQSSRNKKMYYRISVATIILNAMIPIVSLFLPAADIVTKLTITLLSSAATVLTSIQALSGAKDLWTKYRNNASHLTASLHQYYAHTGAFADKTPEEAFQLLSAVCESKMEEEYQQWAQILKDR